MTVPIELYTASPDQATRWLVAELDFPTEPNVGDFVSLPRPAGEDQASELVTWRITERRWGGSPLALRVLGEKLTHNAEDGEA